MIKVITTENIEELRPIYYDTFGVDIVGTDTKSRLFMAIYENGEIKGAGNLCVGETVFLECVCIRKPERGRGLGDMLSRALLNKAIAMRPEKIAVRNIPYFKAFGFSGAADRCTLAPHEIQFPTSCAAGR